MYKRRTSSLTTINKSRTTITERELIIGQATKGLWRMTWLGEAMKDGVSTDMSRGVANRLWSGRIQMGQPSTSYIVLSLWWIHSLREAIPGELKHLSTLRKRNHRDFPSSGERRGNSLNHCLFRKKETMGLRDLNVRLQRDSRSIWKDAP